MKGELRLFASFLSYHADEQIARQNSIYGFVHYCFRRSKLIDNVTRLALLRINQQQTRAGCFLHPVAPRD